MSTSDTCGICEKPFPINTTRFLHLIGHITKGEAVGRFDRRGNWSFRKTDVGKKVDEKATEKRQGDGEVYDQ